MEQMKHIGDKGTVAGFRPLIGEERWHRDDFTAEMLYRGWRPLLNLEWYQKDDQWYCASEEAWRTETTCGQLQCYSVNHRTRRPLPPPQVETFEAAGHVWYRHEPGQPQPVQDDVEICVFLRSHGKEQPLPSKARNWSWNSLRYEENIIGYRFPDYPATMPPEPNKTLQQQQPDAELLELRSFKEKLLQLYHGWFDCVPDSANECMSDLSRLLYPTDEDRCEAEFQRWLGNTVYFGEAKATAQRAWKAAWKAKQ